MKKVKYITLLSSIALLLSQGIWIYNIYQMHLDEFQQRINKSLYLALGQEAGRHIGTGDKGFSDPKKPRIVVRTADSMSPEELEKYNYKGDTVHLDTLTAGFAKNISEVIAQMLQDDYIVNGKLNMPTLDSIFQATLIENKISSEHCIFIYNKEGAITDTIGTPPTRYSPCVLSQKTPIGINGLLVAQAKVEMPLSSLLKAMAYILIVSILLAVIILYCLFYQLIVIRRKDKLLKKREASVNGTVHDLKSPLASVTAALSWLAKSEQEVQKQIVIHSVTSRIRQLTESIESILICARGEKQSIVLHISEVNLPELINAASQEVSTRFNQKPHTIEVMNELKANTLEADKEYLQSVIKNLIENSLKYSDEGTNIRIILSETSQMVQITVTDNGWGIPRKYQRKLFNQYYQVPREAGKMQKGYGVGLSYVRYIIRAHGGDIRLTSREGEGCTFTFTIPHKQK